MTKVSLKDFLKAPNFDAPDYGAFELKLFARINSIVNEVGTSWKTKRALLRQLQVEEPLLSELVPLGGRASDY